MIGYSRDPLKDFLLSPDIESGDPSMYYESKVLSFKIKRDANNWHTMEGGGFLFGATIDDMDRLYGYCVLVTENGLKLYELYNIDIEKFRNGKLGNIANVGVELGMYDIGDVLADHELTLRVNNNRISLWDGDKVIIEDYKLRQLYGGSFGPITSHISHSCSQISYFTFSDIQMSSIEE